MPQDLDAAAIFGYLRFMSRHYRPVRYTPALGVAALAVLCTYRSPVDIKDWAQDVDLNTRNGSDDGLALVSAGWHPTLGCAGARLSIVIRGSPAGQPVRRYTLFAFARHPAPQHVEGP